LCPDFPVVRLPAFWSRKAFRSHVRDNQPTATNQGGSTIQPRVSRRLITWPIFLIALVGCDEPRNPSNPINGCELSNAVDATGGDPIQIRFGRDVGYRYEPECVLIDRGTRVEFIGPFDSHPLGAGRVQAGAATHEPESPIRGARSGSQANFTIESPGIYGYYCTTHAADGMNGAIIVR